MMMRMTCPLQGKEYASCDIYYLLGFSDAGVVVVVVLGLCVGLGCW